MQPGDIIGSRSTVGTCSSSGTPSDIWTGRSGIATAVGSTGTYFSASNQIYEMAASLEPDADNDGYGDETQDQCPRLASAQAACPMPDTTITKVPKKGSSAPASKLSFISSGAGATFTCSLDGKAARTCTSPTKYRCLKPGKHTFSVAATTVFGTDPTPAVAKFKVPQQRKGC